MNALKTNESEADYRFDAKSMCRHTCALCGGAITTNRIKEGLSRQQPRHANQHLQRASAPAFELFRC